MKALKHSLFISFIENRQDCRYWPIACQACDPLNLKQQY